MLHRDNGGLKHAAEDARAKEEVQTKQSADSISRTQNATRLSFQWRKRWRFVFPFSFSWLTTACTHSTVSGRQRLPEQSLDYWTKARLRPANSGSGSPLQWILDDVLDWTYSKHRTAKWTLANSFCSRFIRLAANPGGRPRVLHERNGSSQGSCPPVLTRKEPQQQLMMRMYWTNVRSIRVSSTALPRDDII